MSCNRCLVASIFLVVVVSESEALIQNRAISPAAPGDSQVLRWNAATGQWQPRTFAAGSGSGVFSGVPLDAALASSTAPNRIGTSDPAACKASTRETYYNTVTNTLKICNSDNVWTNFSANAILSVFGRTGAITAQAGDYSFAQIPGVASNAQLPAAGGDLAGTLAGATVLGLTRHAVTSTSPTDGQA